MDDIDKLTNDIARVLRGITCMMLENAGIDLDNINCESDAEHEFREIVKSCVDVKEG